MPGLVKQFYCLHTLRSEFEDCGIPSGHEGISFNLHNLLPSAKAQHIKLCIRLVHCEHQMHKSVVKLNYCRITDAPHLCVIDLLFIECPLLKGLVPLLLHQINHLLQPKLSVLVEEAVDYTKYLYFEGTAVPRTDTTEHFHQLADQPFLTNFITLVIVDSLPTLMGYHVTE